MHVQQVIKASADAVTITHLSPGNVYKRVEEAYGGDASLRFGVIQDVMNNGEDSAVTALEFSPEYGGVVAALKVWNGGKPVAIFPATPDEVRQHFADLHAAAENAVEDAERAVAQKREVLARVETMMADSGSLTSAADSRAVTS